MLETIFKLKKNNTTIKQEINAGIITFLTCAYIIFVNPIILSQTGMNIHTIFISTCIIIFISCILLALITNLPFMLGPGLSMSAFFVYDIVINGNYSFKVALLVIILSSLVSLVVFSIVPTKYIINSIPKQLKHGIVSGSGLFIVIIGLKLSGIIVPNANTLSSLGSLYTLPSLFTIIALMLLLIIYQKNFKLFPVFTLLCFILATIVNLIVITKNGNLYATLKTINFDNYSFPFFAPDFSYFKLSLISLVLALLFAGNYDSLASYLIYKETVSTNNDLQANKTLKKFFIVKAISSCISGFLGSTVITVFLEGTAGIKSGGKTGLVSLTVGILFLSSLILKPIISIVPVWASGAILITVGILTMIASLSSFEWDDYTNYVPAIVAFLAIPLTYSITNGFVFGIISFILIKILSGKFKDINWLNILLGIIFIIYLL